MMKKLTALVALILVVSLLCASALAYTGDVTVKEAKAYADTEGKEYVGTIPAYTSILVSGYKHGVAQAYVKGKVVYVLSSTLLHNRVKPAYGAGLKAGTKVRQRPASSAKGRTLKDNALVYVYTVENGWAMIRSSRKGVYGFVPASQLVNLTKLN